jgi:hypothetical protein
MCLFVGKFEEIEEGLKNNIMEFINAPIEYNKPIVKPHTQAYYTSRLLPFTSSKLNEAIENLDLNITEEDLKSSGIYKKKEKFCIIILCN